MFPQVQLFTISSAKQKLPILFSTLKAHFLKKESCFILCPDDRAMNFIENFLWEFTPESFLPHSLYSEFNQELITFGLINDRSKIVINLCMGVPERIEGLNILYDFEDVSSTEKEKASHERYKAYKKLGCEINCG